MPTTVSALSRRTPSAAPDGSRDRVLAAARREFAAHGFAGASVDRIAAAARLNKAMIYYHFRSKAELYREILRDMFGAASARIRDLASSPLGPEEKVRRFVDAIAIEAEARPHFPPIWFREIADGGKHLDEPTLMEIAGIVRVLAGCIGEGVRTGAFKPVDPLLVHAGIVAPLLLFFASTPLRARLAKVGVGGASFHHRDAVVAHIKRVAIGVLKGRTSDVPAKQHQVRLKPDATTKVRLKPDATKGGGRRRTVER
jgi:AcrR family transcriptional regulator